MGFVRADYWHPGVTLGCLLKEIHMPQTSILEDKHCQGQYFSHEISHQSTRCA